MDREDRANYSVMETLRDGRPIRLRSIRPSDKEGLLDGLHRMNPHSIYTRFHGVKDHMTDAELKYFSEIDFDNHVALLGEVEEAGVWLVVGGARYVIVDRSPRCVAEVAFAVADDFQRQGIATLLFKHLIGLARDEGIQEFMALVLNENKDMFHVFAKSGLRQVARRQGSVTNLHFPLDG